jgi:hypothetical protein
LSWTAISRACLLPAPTEHLLDDVPKWLGSVDDDARREVTFVPCCRAIISSFFGPCIPHVASALVQPTDC